MKILFIYEKYNLEALRSTINYLKQNNHEVDLLCFDSYFNPQLGFVSNKSTLKLIEKYKDKYDVGIVSTHIEPEVMTTFLKGCNFTYGFFSVEHDLFNRYVENSKLDNFLGSISYTKFMSNYMSNNGMKYYEALWYKFDNENVHTSITDGMLNNAILIDTSYTDKNVPFEYANLFNNVYLKNFLPSSRESTFEVQCKTDLKNWWNSQALVKMKDLALFVFVQKSGALVESILMNRIPILWRMPYKEEIMVNEVLSEIFIIENSTTDNLHAFSHKMKIITPKNLEQKLKILRENEEVRNDTLRQLKEQWSLGEGLPSTGQILHKAIMDLSL